MSIMPAPVPSPAPEYLPTKDECAFALLAELLQPFTGFIAPVAILILKRDSGFVKFHALQAIFWHVAFLFIWIGCIAVSMIVMFSKLTAMSGQPANMPPSPQVFKAMAAMYLVLILGLLVNFAIGIVFGVLAYLGKQPKLPLLGHLAAIAVKD